MLKPLEKKVQTRIPVQILYYYVYYNWFSLNRFHYTTRINRRNWSSYANEQSIVVDCDEPCTHAQNKTARPKYVDHRFYRRRGGKLRNWFSGLECWLTVVTCASRFVGSNTCVCDAYYPAFAGGVRGEGMETR